MTHFNNTLASLKLDPIHTVLNFLSKRRERAARVRAMALQERTTARQLEFLVSQGISFDELIAFDRAMRRFPAMYRYAKCKASFEQDYAPLAHLAADWRANR